MSFRPKQNRILATLEEGKIPLGMQIFTGNPSLIEILAYSGFDFYMLCMEHARVNVETMEHCIRAADAAGITTLVRVAENNPTLIRQSIEAGAQGVIVPHIKNKEDARQAANSLRYPPEGTQGICSSVRSANYSTPGWDQFLQHHSSQTMLVALLEDQEAIDKLEEIFAELKPGLDAVLFGRGDLAQSLTKPGEKVDWNHPYVLDAYDKVLALSKRTGIPVMSVPWPVLNTESAKKDMEKGATICLFGIDQLHFYNLCRDIVGELKGLPIPVDALGGGFNRGSKR